MATRPRAVAAPPRGASVPPATGLADLVRLLGGMAGAFVRKPREFSARVVFREWARRMMAHYGSENLVLNLGVRKLLLVGGRDLSQHILEPPPRTDGYSTGELKREGMAVLAPRALTVSDDEQWMRLRPFNERVLQAGQPHELRQAFLTQVHRAFSAPPRTMGDIRAAMGRAMLGIVFGEGVAPEHLTRDVQVLFDLVQHPAKRRLLGPWARTRRARFYGALRKVWREAGPSARPSLVARARIEAQGLPEEQVLEQIPHWMFTFTGSGTDLLGRALVLVSSHSGALDAARREITAAGSLDRADAIDALIFLEGCLREAARLYPPVTRTFHRAAAGATAGKVAIPVGMEILHSFPLLGDVEASAADARGFRPERWLPTTTLAAAPGFDPFLSGARHCPGRELIMFVCKSALAILLGPHRLVVESPLAGDALPPAFPAHGIRFRQG
jgi:cytochrome P450